MIEFRLDPKTGTPFYRQIIDQIKFGIAAGKLKIGEQLPTVRALAVELKVNLNTVAKKISCRRYAMSFRPLPLAMALP